MERVTPVGGPEDRSSAELKAADVPRREFPVGIAREEPIIAVVYAQHLPLMFENCGAYDPPDDRVETGAVAPTRQDRDAFDLGGIDKGGFSPGWASLPFCLCSLHLFSSFSSFGLT